MPVLHLAALLLALVGLSCARSVATPVTPAALWTGKAHFEEVGAFDWAASNGAVLEQAGSFAVQGGTWYVFNRAIVPTQSVECPQDHAGTVVRASTDRGKSWSDPVSAIAPGASRKGDGCAVLDGSAYHDAGTNSWHMLAQCLDRQNAGGWALCHYTRAGTSPLGRFTADPANPVVTGGQLWSRICAGTGKACPRTVADEGTPEIVEARDGRFFVTIHGYDAATRQGYRGMVATRDFRAWQVTGNGLPGDAMLGPRDCAAWLKACAGVGQAALLLQPDHAYMVAETMDRSLGCVPGQEWVFQILRAKRGSWPRSGSGGWQKLPGAALLRPAYRDADTACALQYARWIVDGTDIYLVYEDWGPKRAFVRRRLLKLMPGGNGAVVRVRK